MAATSGVVALSLAGDTEPAVALLPLAIGSIYAAGAIRGNINVNKCRKATGEYESYMAGRETMPEDIASRPVLPPRDMREAPPGAEPPVTLATQPAGPAPGMQPIPAPVVVAPTPAPAPVAAQPPPPQQQPPAQQRPGTKAAPAKKQEPQDDWSDFWREVE